MQTSTKFKLKVGVPCLPLQGLGSMEKADAYLNAGAPSTKSRQGSRWDR